MGTRKSSLSQQSTSCGAVVSGATPLLAAQFLELKGMLVFVYAIVFPRAHVTSLRRAAINLDFLEKYPASGTLVHCMCNSDVAKE
eukprot:1158815-Pelagomonas_calceolata.AAC.6